MPFVTSMLPRKAEAAATGVAAFTVEDDTLDRAAIYGDDNYPEIRAKQNPTDLHDTFSYTWTATSDVSPVSGG